MLLNLVDRVGDWNPQMLREFKGRLKTRNVLISVAISLVGQFLLFMFFQSQLPMDQSEKIWDWNKYCQIIDKCTKDTFGNVLINWPSWWLDVFIWLSVIGIFVLLLAGTYMLISDLAQEQRRGTLNFIRLSPQSTRSILVGKLLGVPILLYLVCVLTMPLHFWAGISAQIPAGMILSFWAIMMASCIFFYSAALLLGLYGSVVSSALPWLGSILMLIFLWIGILKPIDGVPTDWFSLFSPFTILSYLVSANSSNFSDFFSYLHIDKLQWFSLPVGVSFVGTVSLALVNYAVWTYWIWQALGRRFPNPTQTILSKGQSYGLVACFELISLGFATQQPRWANGVQDDLIFNLNSLLVFNLVLFLCLMGILSPQRQALIDWARYRRERVSTQTSFWKSSLIQDLIWAEKSPALVAIAINLAVSCVVLGSWVLIWKSDFRQMSAFAGLAIATSLTLVYAAIAQITAFLQTQKKSQLKPGVALVLFALIVLPPLTFGLLGISPNENPTPWLFSAFSWLAVEQASTTAVFLSFLSQLGILALLSGQLTLQLRRAGESASKALFASRPSLPKG